LKVFKILKINFKIKSKVSSKTKKRLKLGSKLAFEIKEPYNNGKNKCWAILKFYEEPPILVLQN
jgi:hypothetical protein